jgi:glycosyltransferase involved in cell wall biosynthesis
MVIPVPDIPSFKIERYRQKSSDYCLVAIVWNEGNRIRNQVERMATWSSEVDLIIVDGGSDDGSLEENHLRQHEITTLVTVRERGLGTGVRAAMAHAFDEGYQGLVTVDGNGKDDLGGLPLIVSELKDGCRVTHYRGLPKGDEGRPLRQGISAYRQESACLCDLNTHGILRRRNRGLF